MGNIQPSLSSCTSQHAFYRIHSRLSYAYNLLEHSAISHKTHACVCTEDKKYFQPCSHVQHKHKLRLCESRTRRLQQERRGPKHTYMLVYTVLRIAYEPLSPTSLFVRAYSVKKSKLHKWRGCCYPFIHRARQRQLKYRQERNFWSRFVAQDFSKHSCFNKNLSSCIIL